MHENEHPTSRESAIDILEEQLSFLWRREITLSNLLAQSAHPALSANAFGTLSILEQTGPIRLTDMTEIMGVAKSSLSRNLNKLQRSGLIQRRSDNINPNMHIILISDEGKKQLALCHHARVQLIRNLLEGFNTNDAADLAALLTRLNGSLNRINSV